MVSSELTPKLQFLTDAAYLLSASAPETSAFLTSKRNELLVENDVPVSDTHRQQACSCCGHILVPGRGSTLNIETKKASRVKKGQRTEVSGAPAAPTLKKRARSATAATSATSKILTCGNCGRYTALKLPGPRPIRRAKKVQVDQQKTAPETQTQASEPPKASANASSKKRAKNRKAGLQALLNQKQTSTPSSGFGLSLCDFMKK